MVSCGALRQKATTPDGKPQGPEGVKGSVMTPNEKNEDDIASITTTFTDSVRLKGILHFLSADELKGREAGSEGIERAADFIEKIFRQNQIKPFYSSYRDTLGNFSGQAYNIVGLVEGNDPQLKNEYIIIGAHYDHIGIRNMVNGDAIANGANDNASGTAMVLEFARYFGNFRTNKRSLIFVLFSAEEKGLLGSKHLAARMKQANVPLYLVLNFEMTGVPLMGKDYQMYLTGYDKSNLAMVCNAYSDEYLIGYLPTAVNYNLFQRSDNYPFFDQLKVPSHTFCTFDFTNYREYHTVEDEAALMNFQHLAGLVNKLLPVLNGLSNASVREVKLK